VEKPDTSGDGEETLREETIRAKTEIKVGEDENG